MTQTQPLLGRVALVTGASGGLGSSFARALAAAGADVAVHYRSGGDEAASVAAGVREAGRRAIEVQADLTDASAVAGMFGEIVERLGPVDILVANAGVDGTRGKAWELSAEDWRRTIDINLFGTYHCAREALVGMVPRRTGVICNVTSTHESVPWGGYSAYTASKAAVAMMTKTMALEAAEHGVRLLCLAPGAIKTPINHEVWEDPKQLADLRSKIPMRRMAEPDEIARLLVHLVSDDASYVTGTTIVADGGLMLHAEFLEGG